MLNEIMLAKFENEVSGKEVTFPAREKKALKRKYEKYFGDGKWRGSIFDLYLQFLEQQAEKGKAVEVPENSFDVYDLAALAAYYMGLYATALSYGREALAQEPENGRLQKNLEFYEAAAAKM